MDPINATLLLEPVATHIGRVMSTISYLVGGMFGLYLIMFSYKIYTFGKFNRKIDAISEEINKIQKKLNKLRDRKSTRLNSSHIPLSRMPSSA